MKLGSVIGHHSHKSTWISRTLTMLLLGGVLLFASCKKEQTPVAPVVDDITVISGTSFGECIGYCRTEVRISRTVATYTKSSWGRSPAYPEVTTTQLLSTAEWESLLRAIDPSALEKVDSVVGCPDCADGGAEWIEVTYNGTHKKVMFEFDKPIPTIQDLIDNVRAIRTKFES